MKYDKKIAALSIFILGFAFYTYCLCPTVYWGDGMELSLAGWQLGIAHPPGYALYTIILHIWMHSLDWLSGILGFEYLGIVPVEIYYWSNLFSAFCGAAGAALLFLLLEEMHANAFISAAGALFLLFSRDFWAQCRMTEVYSLLLVLDLTAVISAVKYVKNDNPAYLYWCFFFSSLALTTHLTFIFTFTGIIVFLFYSKPELRKKTLLIVKSIFIFTLTFGIVELYFLIRSHSNPAVNWGNPATLQELIGHITAKQYFPLVGVTKSSFAYPLSSIWANFNISLLFVGMGIAGFFRKKRNFFFLTCLPALFITLFMFVFQVEDAESHVVTLIPLGILCMTSGYEYLLKNLKSKIRAPALLFVCFFAISFVQLWLNFGKNNLRGDYQTKDYLVNLMRHVDKNTVIFTQGNSDHYLSAKGYNYVVFPLLLPKEWYRKDVVRRLPELDFSLGFDFRKNANRQYLTDKIWEIIDILKKKHDVIVMNNKSTQFITNNPPEELATTVMFYYLMGQKPHDLPVKIFYRNTEKSRLSVAGLSKVYSAMHGANAMYYSRIGDARTAKKEIDAALSLNRDKIIKNYASGVYSWLGDVEFKNKNYKSSFDCYAKAYDFAPNNKSLLDRIYNSRRMLVREPR